MLRPRSLPHGFTLVELLVVIAIITLLAGLLLPVLQKAMTTARASQGQNQSKQCYLTLTLYADDFGSLIPTGYTGDWKINGSNHCHWMHRLCGAGYADLTWQQMVSCPEPKAQYIGYNANVFDSYSGAANGHYSLAKTFRPSDLYLLGDSRNGYWYSWTYYPGYVHDSSVNITFADGHVRRMQFGTLPGYTWNRMLPYFNKAAYDSNAGISTERDAGY